MGMEAMESATSQEKEYGRCLVWDTKAETDSRNIVNE